MARQDEKLLFFVHTQDLPPKAHYSCPSDVPVQFKSLSEKATIDLHQSNGLGWPVGICKNFVEVSIKTISTPFNFAALYIIITQ